jgi:hypothetical protein
MEELTRPERERGVETVPIQNVHGVQSVFLVESPDFLPPTTIWNGMRIVAGIYYEILTNEKPPSMGGRRSYRIEPDNCC